MAAHARLKNEIMEDEKCNNLFVADKTGITSVSVEPGALLYNNSFTINSTVDGNPNPEISIFSNETGKVLYSGVTAGVVTVLSPLTWCEDAGVWVCAASSYLNEGVNATWSGNITVYCKYSNSGSFSGIVLYTAYSNQSQISLAVFDTSKRSSFWSDVLSY